MEIQQALTILDKFAKEWLENIKELKTFIVEIMPNWCYYDWDDYFLTNEDLEIAEDFPILKTTVESFIEILIINEKKESMNLEIFLDNKKGVDIYLCGFFFTGDISICKSILKLMYRFPETLKE